VCHPAPIGTRRLADNQGCHRAWRTGDQTYRDVLGFALRLDVGKDKIHWITVGPPDQPGTSIVLNPPTASPGITDDERRTITEMMAKGHLGHVVAGH
jgi:hypothetical protein